MTLVETRREDGAAIDIAPLSDALGAEVRGLDLSRPMSAPTFDRLRAAWLRHIVLLFRGQTLSDQALVAFSRRFGPLDLAPVSENRRAAVPGHPEVFVISNVVENGAAIGSLGNAEAFWHSDMSYLAAPPMASALYALEVPPVGGDTGFLNMYQALDSLPRALRAEIEGRSLKHDATTNSAGMPRDGVPEAADGGQGSGAHHPVIRRHPETGRRALYLGRRHKASLDGLSSGESDRLLDALWEHCLAPRFSWHHAWRPGDLLIWDNRCAMHRRDSFSPETRRLMHRTQIKGTRPV